MNTENSQKIKQLYSLYEQAMFRVAFAVLKNVEEAEDAVSESFILIIKNLDKISYPESDNAKHFVLKTIKNKSIDCYRKRKRHIEREMPIEDEIIKDESSCIEDSVINREIISSLNISDDERELIYLRGYDELSWREISDKLQISESTARKRFERLRKKLAKENV